MQCCAHMYEWSFIIAAAPTSLDMIISNSMEESEGVVSLYAGDTTTVECLSEGGTPQADFEYRKSPPSHYTTVNTLISYYNLLQSH